MSHPALEGSQLPRRAAADPLVIGLVNNMPDAALRITEWQIRDLLARAAGAQAVSLRVFSLPEVPRSAAGEDHVRQHHEPIAALWRSDVAGLIVTGTEPRAPSLEDEPYWPAMARLIDWAEEGTVSTIWSCLAAHAAVHRLDGIERRPLGQKMFGVFDCEKAADHPLVRGPSRWRVPHSRNNELPEAPLQRAGYRILSRSAGAGVDMFVRERNSLFVFLQGHPEYDATALFGEYRRDVRRFLAGDNEEYPELPHSYFTAAAIAALLAFRERALDRRDPALLEQFPAAAIGRELAAPWREAATRIYANWLSYLREQLAQRHDRLQASAAADAPQLKVSHA
ncbi:MAG TPA: homoserine O-succinyltransferase [Stellaceae bacterium]|nr:homoserine O-succinyltransferase [Stellaceae bacterium]